MPGMDHSRLPPFGWTSLVHDWTFSFGWTIGILVSVGAYLYLVHVGRRHGARFPGWRVACFSAGGLLLLATLSSAIAVYAMAVFWVHMVEHLILIMVVPALVILGHPLTAVRNALRPGGRRRFDGVLRSGPLSALTHPLTALTLYAVVIIGTHLTGFMDAMANDSRLMTGEQVVYLASGCLLFLPILGREPIRRDVPYLLRIVLVLVAMVPDTVVGIVLLQTDHVSFPAMFAMHPSWAPDPVQDQQIAGALMWAAGDGLMMLAGVGVVLMMILDPHRERVLGSWLESVRRQTLAEQARAGTGASSEEVGAAPDPESGEALGAYNAMLAALHEREQHHGGVPR
ncbi:cytochrome c oxidase assembly protein [Nocardioides marmorisolisilvae]|nr:cytochrome c oxidase assembly protein [Nocardioides marmorisolisilvae]